LLEKKSRYGKIFYSCSRYPQCKYALWDLPLTQPCPKCSFPLTVQKTTIREGTVRRCPQEGCDFKEVLVAPEKKAATAPAASKTGGKKPAGVKKKPVTAKKASKK
jgi:DNA topoisomerase-1